MDWIIFDTETNGIRPPIFTLELAAQRMRDWLPEGPPFRRLLNHNQDIQPEASRINGFTREILERDDEPPLEVYADFADYAADLPFVAYNLDYDLDKVLIAHRRGLHTWQQLQAFVMKTWFPSRITFGKHKGRHFSEARTDPELHGWLQWLASSSNARSAEMGRWIYSSCSKQARKSWRRSGDLH